MSLDDQIKNLCNPGTPTSEKFCVCRECGQIHKWDTTQAPPAACSKCAKVNFATYPNIEAATVAWKQFSGPKTPEAPVDPTPQTSPEPTKIRRPRATKPPVSGPTTDGSPTPSAMDSDSPVSAGGEARAARETAEKSLIHTAKINQVTPVEIGTGVVDAIGYTTWVERDGARRPVYHFMELTDTANSFSNRIEEARQEDGNIMIDCARVVDLSDPLHGCVFGGQLVASLRNGRTRVRALPATKVRIAARLSVNGRLIYNLTGVKQ